MESKSSLARHQAENVAWSISSGTRRGAQAADIGMATDDWLYAPSGLPPQAAPQPNASPLLPPMPPR
ncbi:MAG: hypothetical protein M3Y54_17800 [Bacteroidota bacterium]|jgi:hypothetical protein|nr:hypothetical protein [Bacteroidota bacterium]